MLEDALRNSLRRLGEANDRLWGGDKSEGGTVTAIAPRGGGILPATLNCIDRLSELAGRLEHETYRTDNISGRQPTPPTSTPRHG